MHGPIHLQCPACGHVFMTNQSRGEAVQSCAHCAFVAPGSQFHAIHSTSTAAPILFQRRTARVRPDESPPPPDPTTSDPFEPVEFSTPRSHFTQTGTHQRIPQGSMHSAAPAFADEIISPQRKSPVLRWLITFILFIAVCSVTGLLAWEKIQHRIRLQKLNATAKAATQSIPPSATGERHTKPLDHLDGSIITQAALADAERLIGILFNAPGLEERLTVIDTPDTHRAGVKAFFDANPDRPQLISTTPISNPPLSLRDHTRIPMFKVATSQNHSGALAWVTTSQTGQPLIHWPLFRETHEKALTRFLKEKSDIPSWFYVGLRRTHPFDLPEDQRSEYEAFDIDGSTDGTGRALVFVHKKTPLSRALAGRLQWNEFYYGRVLVSWMDLAGQKRAAMLDCEGNPEAPAAPVEK